MIPRHPSKQNNVEQQQQQQQIGYLQDFQSIFRYYIQCALTITL